MNETEADTQANANSESQTQQPPLDESIIERPKVNVCSDYNMILARKATEEFQNSKTLQKLKKERLMYEIQEIVAKTPTKQLEQAKQEFQRSEQSRYESIEKEKHATLGFLRISRMIEELTIPITAFRKSTETVVARSEKFSEDLAELLEIKKKSIEWKKTIEALEIKIKELMGKPEPQVDQNLVQENLLVIKLLEEKQAQLEDKRLKKAKMEAHKSKKITLLEEIGMKQEKIHQHEENMEKERAYFNDLEQKRSEQVEELKAKIVNNTQKRDSLLKKIQSECQTIEEVDREIEEFVMPNTEKRAKLQQLQQQIKDRQQAADTTKNEELNIEKEELAILNKQLQDMENKKLELLMKKSENAAILLGINDIKPKLQAELLEEKNQLELKQQLVEEKADQLKTLKMKCQAEQLLVEDLKAKQINASLRLEDAKKKQMQNPIEFEQLRNEIRLKHEEKLGEQLKIERNRRVDIDLAKANADEKSRELENFKKELEDEEETLKVAQLKLERNNKTLRRLADRDKSLDSSLKNYEAKLRERERNVKSIKKPEVSPIDELLQIGNLKTKSQIKSENPVSIIEPEEQENKQNASGRKSPGILKSPFKNPKFVQNRRVTFDGVPSQSSSSTTSPSEQKVPKRKADSTNLNKKVAIEDDKKRKMN